MSLAASDYQKYIHWGTSTWTFEGWRNQVYFKEYKNKKHFNHASLAEYCAHPKFGVIGMDLWHYRVPTEETLAEYAQYIPAGFPICIKVINEITTFRWPQMPSYAARGGTVNPHFLNADKFLNEFSPPFEKVFIDFPLIFIFELMTIPLNDLPGGAKEFSVLLDAFLEKLPAKFRYAMEIRNKHFIDPVYFEVLKKHRVAHCYNQWANQYSIGRQLELGEFSTDFVVVRALQPPGWNHNQSQEFFKPFDRVKLILPEVRQDILTLIRQMLAHQIHAYILINNRLEGNAPTTIEELDEMVRQQLLNNR